MPLEVTADLRELALNCEVSIPAFLRNFLPNQQECTFEFPYKVLNDSVIVESALSSRHATTHEFLS